LSIGNNVTIKCGTNIWDAIRIEDDVFLGPNVTFTNDPTPRSKKRVKFLPTLVKKGASLGSSTTILPGITIGSYAMTGAGSVITKNIPDYALVYGNPAKWHAWIDELGRKLKQTEPGFWVSEDGCCFQEIDDALIKL
jgi:acetyltransferase-like isoleucine patch superfamily enzyme